MFIMADTFGCTDAIPAILEKQAGIEMGSGAEPLRYAYVIVDVEFLKSNGIDPEEVKYSSHIHDQKASELFDRAFESFSSDDLTASAEPCTSALTMMASSFVPSLI